MAKADYDRGKRDALKGLLCCAVGSKNYGDYYAGHRDGKRQKEGPDEIDLLMKRGIKDKP